MRKKTLLTAALCLVLALAADAMGGGYYHNDRITRGALTAYAEESKKTGSDEEGKPRNEESGPNSSPTEPSATPPTESQPTESQPTETQPPTESQPTEPPQTEKQPATEPPQTEKQPSATEPSQTETSTTAPTEPSQTETSTTAPTESSQTETQPPATEAPAETQPPATEIPAETQPPATEVPAETQPPATEAPATEQVTEPETETEKETKKKEKETETESEEPLGYGTNEALLAHQHIVTPPEIEQEFRFTQVEKRYAIISSRDGAKVYEEKSGESKEVGSLNLYGCCYILEDKGDGWYYIESGNVRGFIKADDAVCDDVAQRIVNVKGMDELTQARLLVARSENAAFDHTHTTVQEVMASLQYALASGRVTIYEQKNAGSRAVGTLEDGALCYMLADTDSDGVFVESGSARGFVSRDDLITGSAAASEVSDQGEKNMPLAEVLISPEDNKACYYTLTSVKEASQAARTREAIVKFALQFVGNPYVWGGTSLTQGADCSGFVQSVYANFGYSLPRVAEDQAGYGMQIPVSSAAPGDLIFYARHGYVYHVSMYIGNGQVVQAAGRRVGIITSGIDGNAVWATRIITD